MKKRLLAITLIAGALAVTGCAKDKVQVSDTDSFTYPNQIVDTKSSDASVFLNNCPNYMKVITYDSVLPITKKDYIFNHNDFHIKVGELREGQKVEILMCKNKTTGAIEVKYENSTYSILNKELISK